MYCSCIPQIDHVPGDSVSESEQNFHARWTLAVGEKRCVAACQGLSMNELMLQVLMGRGEKVPESPAGPVVVCTRNDDLDAVVEATPTGRRKGNLVSIEMLHAKALHPPPPSPPPPPPPPAPP